MHAEQTLLTVPACYYNLGFTALKLYINRWINTNVYYLRCI